MTRNEWVKRFASRYAKLTGDEPDVARVVAETEAHNLTWDNGDSGAAWPSPENAADDLADLLGVSDDD